MIYAVINGNETLFDTWEEYNTATFSPATESRIITDFVVSGKDYASRKACARDIGVEISHTNEGGLAWSEYTFICMMLEKIAKRYGLVEEFRENGLIGGIDAY